MYIKRKLDFSDDVNILEEENVKATMKDKDGNEIEMNGSLDNVFDGRDDTFLEIVNGMALKLTLEEQIKLMGLIIKMKQGLNSAESSPGNGRRIMPSITQKGSFLIKNTLSVKRKNNDIFSVQVDA